MNDLDLINIFIETPPTNVQVGVPKKANRAILVAIVLIGIKNKNFNLMSIVSIDMNNISNGTFFI